MRTESRVSSALDGGSGSSDCARTAALLRSARNPAGLRNYSHILFSFHESSMVLAACSGVVFPAATSALTSLKTRPVSGPSS
jgi:hypothetical protein